MTASLAGLIQTHTEALAAYDADHDTHDQENDATGFAVDAARDALLAHRPTTIEEVATKAAYMASNRTFTEWDNFEQVQLINALTPALANDAGKLTDLIAIFHSAKIYRDEAWAADPDYSDGPEQEMLDDVEAAIVRHPCQTMAGARQKAKFFLENKGPYDTIRNCTTGGEETLLPFLRSLAGGGCIMSRIAELIEAHRQAFQALEAACGITDKAEGDEALAAAEAAQEIASDATCDTLREIIDHPFSRLDELKEAARYLAEHHRTTGDGDPAVWFQRLAYALAGMPEDEI